MPVFFENIYLLIISSILAVNVTSTSTSNDLSGSVAWWNNIHIYLAGIIGAAATYGAKIIYGYFYRPKITVEIVTLGKDKPYEFGDMLLPGDYNSSVLRLVVTNKGRTSAHNCIVKIRSFLIEEEEKEEPKNTILHWHRNKGPFQLLFDPVRIVFDAESFNPISISPNDKEWIDLYCSKHDLTQNESQLHFLSKHPVHCSAGKKYRIEIWVYGDNVHSGPHSFQIYWDGRPENFRNSITGLDRRKN